MRRTVQVDEKLSLAATFPLSLQHLFAMFGATILVPLIFMGASKEAGVPIELISIVLLMNGIGTILYTYICKNKIPAYLGSSFAFISPVLLVIPTYGYQAALWGFIAVGLTFIVVAVIVKYAGTKWMDVLFPPAAMGAIVAVIGLELAGSAAQMAGLVVGSAGLSAEQIAANPGMQTAWIQVSLFTLAVTIACNVFFRGFLAIVPVLVGVLSGYAFAAFMGLVDISGIASASWFAVPHTYAPKFVPAAMFTILPAALVVVVEHVGHLIVTGNIVGKELTKDPGLYRSLLGNGIATTLSGLFGSSPSTTYGENIGVMALTKVYSTWVIKGAAIIAIVLSLIGKFAAVVASIPTPVMGGVCLLLFGVIAASGIRILVEGKVDYSQPKNLVLTAVILIIGISGAQINMGAVSLKGMALATVVGMILALVFALAEKISPEQQEG